VYGIVQTTTEIFLAWETKCGTATGYSLLSYVTAWLKTYYPIEFMTSLMISEKGNYQQISKYIIECKRMNIKVLPPSINMSNSDFNINNKDILFGLSVLKNIGVETVENIIQNRPYKTFKEFLEKNKVDISTVISLIKGGAFDELDTDRKKLLQEYCLSLYEPLTFKENKTINKKQKDMLIEEGYHIQEHYKDNIFCLCMYNLYKKKKTKEKNNIKLEKHTKEFEEKYMTGNKADWEFESLSIYLTEDPYEKIRGLKSFNEFTEGISEYIIGTIIDIKYKNDKNRNKFCYIDLLDHTGEIIELLCGSKIYTMYYELIKKGFKVICYGVKREERFIVKNVQDYDTWEREHFKED